MKCNAERMINKPKYEIILYNKTKYEIKITLHNKTNYKKITLASLNLIKAFDAQIYNFI